MSNPVGRPLEYNDEILQKTKAYLADCRAKKTTPYIEELADEWLDCDDDTIVEWAKKYPEFSATIKRVKMRQKLELLKSDGAMKIFQLKANHGMIETEKKIISDPNGEAVVFKIVEDTKENTQDKNS